jgi:hypothetical protein
MVEGDCGVGVDGLERNEERARLALFRERGGGHSAVFIPTGYSLSPIAPLRWPVTTLRWPPDARHLSPSQQISPGPILQPRTLEREAWPVQAAAACGHDVWVGGSKGWGWRAGLRGVGSA